LNTLFKALSDPTRRRILELLRGQDMTAGEVAACFQISKPSISHHLDLLKRADLVVAYREGQFIRYALNATVLEELLQWIMALNRPDSDREADDKAPPNKPATDEPNDA
jgi:DNA-binding transcriptional ArsR family regulator